MIRVLFTPSSSQFHQVVRASTPLFTIFISVALMGTPLNVQKLLTLIPVMMGVGFACVLHLSL